jgi:hypothetical protein
MPYPSNGYSNYSGQVNRSISFALTRRLKTTKTARYIPTALATERQHSFRHEFSNSNQARWPWHFRSSILEIARVYTQFESNSVKCWFLPQLARYNAMPDRRIDMKESSVRPLKIKSCQVVYSHEHAVKFRMTVLRRTESGTTVHLKRLQLFKTWRHRRVQTICKIFFEIVANFHAKLPMMRLALSCQLSITKVCQTSMTCLVIISNFWMYGPEFNLINLKLDV